jgi:hypothetical protein
MKGSGLFGPAEAHKAHADLVETVENVKNAAVKWKGLYSRAGPTICPRISGNYRCASRDTYAS